MTETERKPRVRRVTVSSHVSLDLAGAIERAALQRGISESAYIAGVLAAHEGVAA